MTQRPLSSKSPAALRCYAFGGRSWTFKLAVGSRLPRARMPSSFSPTISFCLFSH